MSILLLPRASERALRSFGVAVGLLAATVGLTVSALAGWPLWPAVLTAMALAVAGFVRPGALRSVYRLWNRVARRYGRLATNWILTVAYRFVVGMTGRGDAPALGLTRPEPTQSLWTPRETLPAAAYSGMGWQPGVGADSRANDIEYLRSSLRGRTSALALAPFVLLLRLLETEQDDGNVPTHNYTLY